MAGSSYVTCKCALHLDSLIQTNTNGITSCSMRDLASIVLVRKSNPKFGKLGGLGSNKIN
jgi:hypothetical protein